MKTSNTQINSTTEDGAVYFNITLNVLGYVALAGSCRVYVSISLILIYQKTEKDKQNILYNVIYKKYSNTLNPEHDE